MVLEVPRPDPRGLHVLSDAREDDVAHGQAVVLLAVVVGAGRVAVTGDAVVVGGRLEVELLLGDNDPVLPLVLC